MLRGLSLAYPLVVFPLQLRTLEVNAPVSPLAAVMSSFLSDAYATNWTWSGTLLDNGWTATMTGMVKEIPGRTASGGSISKVMLYSQPLLPVL